MSDVNRKGAEVPQLAKSARSHRIRWMSGYVPLALPLPFVVCVQPHAVAKPVAHRVFALLTIHQEYAHDVFFHLSPLCLCCEEGNVPLGALFVFFLAPCGEDLQDVIWFCTTHGAS